MRGVLPKGEYQELGNQVLGQLLRTLNPDELKKVSGDVFGRIYEYFLTQFADQKARDGGEFFTPISLVSLIAHVLDPGRGTVLDPACGSGGMFAQSARIVWAYPRSVSASNQSDGSHGIEINFTDLMYQTHPGAAGSHEPPLVGSREYLPVSHGHPHQIRGMAACQQPVAH